MMSETAISSSVNAEFKNPRVNVIYGARRWKRCLRLGDLRLYVTWNWRLKGRNKRDNIRSFGNSARQKKQLVRDCGGACEACGGRLEGIDKTEIHHVLPLAKFPQLYSDKRNKMCLCHECHCEIHNNIYKNLAMQEAKAQELGINLKEYYGV